MFSVVLNEISRGLEEDDEGPPVDRGYWEGRAGKDILGMADHLLDILRKWEPTLELKYNKSHIGVAKDGMPDLFVKLRPKRQFLRVEARIQQSDEMDAKLEEAGLDVMPYKWDRYRIRLTKADLA